VVTVVIEGAGTTEAEWRPWLDRLDLPEFDLAAVAAGPVLVVAAHPDDEVLAVGGLLHRLGSLGCRPRCVWASDGEASHPGSRAPLAARLGVVRRAEVLEATARLGVAPEGGGAFLGLPDGGLATHEDDLAAQVRQRAGAGTTVLAPWRGDGHPDHAAAGRAAAAAAAAVPGAVLLEYPVWAWHWARPGDPRVPWSRALRVPLDRAEQRVKAHAVHAFRSQVAPIGPAPEDAAVLPPAVVARFARPYEVLLR
jgi:LmbE family N-acetylglucosaminyl deacetylase